jgi:hypothetical protein
LLRESTRGLLDLRPEARLSAWWMWRLALLASLAIWFLHGIVDYFYEPLPTNLAFWLVGALVVGAARLDKRACV